LTTWIKVDISSIRLKDVAKEVAQWRTKYLR
jgi:hypothetical protein